MNGPSHREESAAEHGDHGDDAAGRTTWRLDLSYEGTAFHGWARQPAQRTVEGVLLEVLETVLGERVRLSVAGRTDAGVHAWAQVASFSCARSGLRPELLRHSLNALLPPDVAVTRVAPVSDAFVAREAQARTYAYALWVSAVKPVRERAYVWSLRGEADAAALRAAAGLLPGRRDFAALTPSARLYHSCRREVTAAGWRDVGATADGEGRRWRFEITAGSFLHNMVRVAVGSMVDVAQGRMSLDAFAHALQGGERRRMGQTAPARGLALVGVDYGDAPSVSSSESD